MLCVSERCTCTLYVLRCIWDDTDDVRVRIASLWFHLSHVCCLTRCLHCGFLIIIYRKCKWKEFLDFIWELRQKWWSVLLAATNVMKKMRTMSIVWQTGYFLNFFNQKIFSALIFGALFFQPNFMNSWLCVFFVLQLEKKTTKLTYSIDFYDRAWQEITIEGKKHKTVSSRLVMRMVIKPLFCTLSILYELISNAKNVILYRSERSIFWAIV